MIIMTTYFTRTSVLIKRHDAVWHLLMVQPEYTRTNPTDASKLNMPTKVQLGMPSKLRKARLRSSQLTTFIYSNIISAQKPVLEIR